MTWMQTLTGKPFNLLNPSPKDVKITEIAHALSNLCRFAGHTRIFYSVAEHSVRVADILPASLKIYGLLHDAHEAYIGDITTPVALCLDHDRALIRLKYRIQRAIHEAVGLDWPLDESTTAAIHEADLILLMTERRDLFAGPPQRPWEKHESITPLAKKIIPWSPRTARAEFSAQFNVLAGAHTNGMIV